MRHTLTTLLLAAFALPAVAQTNRFSATTGDVSLSGAATTLTIQRPAAPDSAGAKTVTLEAFQVYCSVACSVTQAFNGTNATATAATISSLPPGVSAVPFATAWTSSNVGNGTASGGITHVPAGSTVIIPVANVRINGPPAASNYSVTVASITGTANITGVWSERQ